jgi:hypothetical protein
MLRCVNDGVVSIKYEHQTTGNVSVIWSDEFLHAVPYIREILHLEKTQGSLQSRMPGSVPTMTYGGGSVMV